MQQIPINVQTFYDEYLKNHRLVIESSGDFLFDIIPVKIHFYTKIFQIILSFTIFNISR